MRSCEHHNQRTGTCNLLYNKYCRNCGDIHCEKCFIEKGHRLDCTPQNCPKEATDAK
jgi:hypothetical protein